MTRSVLGTVLSVVMMMSLLAGRSLAAGPAKGDFVSIAPEFNYPDPFGREWRGNTDTGMVILQPGQSTEWKVRLELLPLAGKSSL